MPIGTKTIISYKKSQSLQTGLMLLDLNLCSEKNTKLLTIALPIPQVAAVRKCKLILKASHKVGRSVVLC